MMIKQYYQVIVIGGGHAGCEAASASSRLNCDTLLITKDKSKIGEMSCNPSIGGVAKGIMVREIDALGGIMGQAIDLSGTHFKILNASKGPAVHGPRAQADRILYKKAIQSILNEHQNLDILDSFVDRFIIKNNKITGIEIADGTCINAEAVILTTGTFLNGKIYCGDKVISAGRAGEKASTRLADDLYNLGLNMGRMKTGTPPRIDGNTIDYRGLDIQEADAVPKPFSFLNKEINIPQIGCSITHTNSKTHDIIHKYLHTSAMYSGKIESKGPRYCPAIEDKIVRFSDKNKHQIFLEKEGLNDHIIYPNGISTSLSEKTQELFVKTIKGLENCKITQYGYAIEYDYIDARELRRTLESNKIDGFFCAGQINGSTGYEEAAVQGIIAGFNAALKAQGKEEFILDRSSAYIGVLIDDLITLGTNEPYRMFTSRVEYRLSIRADNADLRLTEKAINIGAICKQRKRIFSNKLEQINKLREILLNKNLSSTQLKRNGFNISQDGKRRNGLELLSLKEVSYKYLVNIWSELNGYAEDVVEQMEIEGLYISYLQKQNDSIRISQQEENTKIPKGIKYENIKELSHEIIEKLNYIKPDNIAMARRISGVTPVAIMAIIIYIKRIYKK